MWWYDEDLSTALQGVLSSFLLLFDVQARHYLIKRAWQLLRVYLLPSNKHPNNIYLKSAEVAIKNNDIDIVIIVEGLLILLSKIIYQSLASIFKC